MRTLLGVLVMCLPLIVVFLWVAAEEGLQTAIIIFGFTLGVIAVFASCIALGAILISGAGI